MCLAERGGVAVVKQWLMRALGYLDAGWCRQRADDWCEQPVMPPALPAPMSPVSEPSAALMLACGLVALGILRRMRA